jgi:hypothetical protein
LVIFFQKKHFIEDKARVDSDKNILSREELQLIIRSLDEGICIKKYKGNSYNSDLKDTQFFTNSFFEGVFKFALEKSPDGTFKDNTDIVSRCMKSKVFQLDQD